MLGLRVRLGGMVRIKGRERFRARIWCKVRFRGSIRPRVSGVGLGFRLAIVIRLGLRIGILGLLCE